MISSPSARCSICYNTIKVAAIQETTMDLPVKFPSETEVILEEVARFRALSPRERIRKIVEMIREETDRINRSPDAEAIWARLEEEKNLERKSIREFLARHGY
jgi:hypothetical protein